MNKSMAYDVWKISNYDSRAREAQRKVEGQDRCVKRSVIKAVDRGWRDLMARILKRSV